MNIIDIYQLFLHHQQVTTDSRNCPKDSMFFALKGERFDGNKFAEKALEACVASANRDDYRGIGEYKRLGYVPAYSDPKKWENWSLSKTLEYAYDDYCIARMAEKMGKAEIAKEFYAR